MPITDRTKGIELSLLGIFRGGVVVVMLLLVVVTLVLLSMGIYNWTSSHMTTIPEPAKSTLPVPISKDSFLQSLQPKATATTPATQSDASSQLAIDNGEAKFRQQAEKLWVPVSKYQSDCALVTPLKYQEFIETLRESPLKEILESRGEVFAQNQLEFVSATLGSTEILQLCKSGQQGLFFATLEFHRNQWDIENQRIKDFDESERLRLNGFKDAEKEKSSSKLSFAYDSFRGAAIVFGLFMSLALLLVFARIELNLRRVSTES